MPPPRTIGAGLDTVRHDGVRSAMQLVHALDADDVGAGAGNAAPMETRQLARSTTSGSRAAFSMMSPLGQAGCHHQVLGTGHGNHVGTDARPFRRVALAWT